MDKVLHAHLLEQKQQIVKWANEIENARVREWLDRWLPDDLAPTISFDRIVTNVGISELLKLGKPEYADFIKAIRLFARAVDKFVSGESAEALKLTFSTEFSLGCKFGRKAHNAFLLKQKNAAVHKDTYEFKRILLEYYVKQRLERLSNEQAAKEIVKANLVKIAHRTLVAYISEYKKLLRLCEQSEAGIAISTMYVEAQKTLENTNGVNVERLQQSENVLKWVEEHRLLRVSKLISVDFETAKRDLPAWEYQRLYFFSKS